MAACELLSCKAHRSECLLCPDKWVSQEPLKLARQIEQPGGRKRLASCWGTSLDDVFHVAGSFVWALPSLLRASFVDALIVFGPNVFVLKTV